MLPQSQTIAWSAASPRTGEGQAFFPYTRACIAHIHSQGHILQVNPNWQRYCSHPSWQPGATPIAEPGAPTNALAGQGLLRQYLQQHLAAAESCPGPGLSIYDVWQPGDVWNVTLQPWDNGSWLLLLEDVAAPEGPQRHLAGTCSQQEFANQLQQHVARCRRHGIYEALLLLDMDNSRKLHTYNNSTLHPVLTAIARRLHNTIRLEDSVTHLGGDQFAVLLSDLGKDPEDAARRARKVAYQLQETLHQPYQWNQKQNWRLTFSIGILMLPRLEHSPQQPVTGDLLQAALQAAQKAKERQYGGIQLHTPELEAESRQRDKLERQLLEAVKQDQLRLHFQPQWQGQQLQGLEALVRWQHPQRGLLLPGEFIPVAETSGLIVSLGEWVLAAACSYLRQLLSQGCPYPPRIAVNVSPQQFRQGDFVNKIKAIIDKYQVPPQLFELELTESTLLADFSDANQKIEQLRQFGLRFAIDDFGTGYSSLAYLRQLPVDMLKIDRSFIHNLHQDPQNAAIVRSILDMARHFKLQPLAEGVDSVETMHYLAQLGCYTWQGFLNRRPQPWQRLEPLWRQR